MKTGRFVGGKGLFKSSIFLTKHCRLQMISSSNNASVFVLIHGKSTRILSFADWDCEEVKCNLCPDHPISFPRCEYCLNCSILFQDYHKTENFNLFQSFSLLHLKKNKFHCIWLVRAGPLILAIFNGYCMWTWSSPRGIH